MEDLIKEQLKVVVIVWNLNDFYSIFDNTKDTIKEKLLSKYGENPTENDVFDVTMDVVRDYIVAKEKQDYDVDLLQVLQDDETEFGGIGFMGETLLDFLISGSISGLPYLDKETINIELKKCGIKTIK